MTKVVSISILHHQEIQTAHQHSQRGVQTWGFSVKNNPGASAPDLSSSSLILIPFLRSSTVISLIA